MSKLLVKFLVKTYRCFVLYVLAEDFDGLSVSYECEIKYKIIIASTSKYKRKNMGGSMKIQVPVVLVSVFYIQVVGIWSSSDHHAIPKALNNITPVIYHPVTEI